MSADTDALRSTLSFLASVIRCGEPFSPDVQQALANAHLRLDHLEVEAGNTRWIKADPDDPTTWPESGFVVYRLSAEGLQPRRRTGYTRITPTALHFGLSPDVHDADNVWSASSAMTLHWMPWSAIGDPT